MENLIKQRRVRFSDPEPKEPSSSRERTVLTKQTDSFKRGKKLQDWFQRQFARQMSQDYDSQDKEFAVGVAAAAFSISTLEEAEAQQRMKKREEFEKSRTKIKSEKEDTTGMQSSGRVTRPFSGKDKKSSGETFRRNLMEQNRPGQETSHQSFARPVTPAAGDPKQKGNSSRHTDVGTRADAWEKAKMEMLNKQFQKIRSTILAWENEKKMQAKLKMESEKGELEKRRKLNELHYQNKIARINQIAEGARAQLEEKTRNKESEVKEKAKKIRSTE
ncbi:Remorin_C domain-containing protein [Cephalotus follicularis]|uniref:Remorin_C domain-containing protein n=1 Tax=Cephalotus follicularis TaxID=3775 RepID=A0A1Q3BK59_CEPFO|nr:Remorin_C domain-containing protein [Cephalotus follicularis]